MTRRSRILFACILVAGTALATPSTSAAQTAARTNPFGVVDRVNRAPGGIRLVGWALDPDTTSPIEIHVHRGTTPVATATANLARADVGGAFPGFGENHGFDIVVPLPPGQADLCIFGINVGPGGNAALACGAVVVESSPFGAFDGATRVPGGLRVSGWAIDPDSVGPIEVHLYSGTNAFGAAAASSDRPDIGAAFVGYGNAHGFDARLPLGRGSHRICAYAINVGPAGANALLGCKDVTVDSDPTGSLEAITPAPGGIRVSGFALDRDVLEPIGVHVYIDGSPAVTLVADQSRAGVVRPFGDYGDAHYYGGEVGLGGGLHQVCAYGVNVGEGANNLLGCQRIVVESTPFGALDLALRAPGGVRVVGWAIDRDRTSSIEVQIYANGAFIASIAAADNRADVERLVPGFGPLHGFDTILAIGAGSQRVCAYGIDQAGGSSNRLLGCRSLVIESSPIGALDSVITGASQIRVTGWALDPDTGAPIDVHVYANGAGVAAVSANLARSDILRLFPAYGAEHGYDQTVVVGPGNYSICTYAINVEGGASRQLGCKPATIT